MSFYVSKHTKAKAKDKHLFLKNPEVLFCSAAEELVCSAPPQVVVQDDSWLKGVDVPDTTKIQYEFKSEDILLHHVLQPPCNLGSPFRVVRCQND